MRRSKLKAPPLAPAPSQTSEADVKKVLNRSKTRDAPGAPTTLGEQRMAEAVKFLMVLEPDVAAMIERLRQQPVRMSRRHWIRMAIAEKIERDK